MPLLSPFDLLRRLEARLKPRRRVGGPLKDAPLGSIEHQRLVSEQIASFGGYEAPRPAVVIYMTNLQDAAAARELVRSHLEDGGLWGDDRHQFSEIRINAAEYDFLSLLKWQSAAVRKLLALAGKVVSIGAPSENRIPVFVVKPEDIRAAQEVIAELELPVEAFSFESRET